MNRARYRSIGDKLEFEKRRTKLMPPSDEGGGQPLGCSEGEKTEGHRF